MLEADLLPIFDIVTKELTYTSETDAPIKVQLVMFSEWGESVTSKEINTKFYENKNTGKMTSRSMRTSESAATDLFFKKNTVMVEEQSDGSYYTALPKDAEKVQKWRVLRDFIFDNLVEVRYFRVPAMDNKTKFDIYVIGRHINVTADANNTIKTELGNWIVLSTYAIET